MTLNTVPYKNRHHFRTFYLFEKKFRALIKNHANKNILLYLRQARV
jgi:hypothetical protein